MLPFALPGTRSRTSMAALQTLSGAGQRLLQRGRHLKRLQVWRGDVTNFHLLPCSTGVGWGTEVAAAS